MADDGDQAPPPGFMEGPPTYDLEELIHITRLEGELHRLLEQILHMDPNGMLRIHLVLQRVQSAVIVDRRFH